MRAPTSATMGDRTAAICAGLYCFPRSGAECHALRHEPQLMQPAAHRRGEEQACRSDEKTRYREQRRQRLERHARAALYGDEDRRGEELAARKGAGDRRELEGVLTFAR